MTKVRTIFLFFFVAILVLFYFAIKNYYTLDEVCKLLNSVKLPSNVYLKEYEYSDEYTYYTDIYIKDNIEKSYLKRKTSSLDISDIDAICIYENQKTVDIDNINKMVTIFNDEENNDIYIPNKHSFFNSVEQHGLDENLGIYKYCGKENMEGKKCIKISFTDKKENEINIDYYYIDIESNLIIKFQSYSGENIKELELIRTITWEYQFDVVKDSDIKKFDINDYPGYEIHEFKNEN